jgi:hypothetical protein
LTGLKNNKNCPNYHHRRNRKHLQRWLADEDARGDGDDELIR